MERETLAAYLMLRMELQRYLKLLLIMKADYNNNNYHFYSGSVVVLEVFSGAPQIIRKTFTCEKRKTKKRIKKVI